MICKKEKNIHIYSVLVLVFAISLFFILGGGSKKSEKNENVFEVNSSIPSAKQESLASGKFDAKKRESFKNEESKRREKLQHNSFDLFKSNKKDSSGCTLNSSASSSGMSKTSHTTVNDKKGRIQEREGCKNRDMVVEKKDHIMKKKRVQLEKEFGINLSDYGYEKYEQKDEEIESFSNDNSNCKPGFYGLESEALCDESDIKAVVHGAHNNIASGSIVKMRLLDEVIISGEKVPKNTFVYGKLSFKDGRGIIYVKNINVGGKVVKFYGSIYDTDGFEGISIPKNIVSSAKDDAAYGVVDGISIDVSSKSRFINSSVSAVGDAVKGAVQGSIKEKKISISSNYMIIIKNKK